MDQENIMKIWGYHIPIYLNLKFTLNSDFGTLSSLFDSKSEAESRADAYRKLEPDTEFWVEEFPTAGELNDESCGGEF